MRTTLAILFAAVLYSAVGKTVVDFYLDMEAGTNGQAITTNLLTSCTHVASGVGRWTINQGSHGTPPFGELSAITNFTVLVTNLALQLRSPVSVAGTTYNNANHSRVFGYSLNSRDQGAQWNFTTPKQKISLGYYYTMAVGFSLNPVDRWCNILSVMMYNDSNYPSAWEYDIMGATIENRVPRVNVHCQSGGAYTPGITRIQISVEKTYWITQLWDGQNGVAKVEVYDPVTWAKVGGTSSLSLSNMACSKISFGDSESDQVGDNYFSVTNCFGNLIMDWTTATFPLLLPAAPPPPPTNLVISWTPANPATLEHSTNGNQFAWQTYSNNATPPVTVPIQRLRSQELFRVRSSHSTTMSYTTQ